MISQALYKRHTEEWWKGKRVVSLQPLRNAWGEMPAGTRLEVTRKFSGFNLESLPCTKCGFRLRINKVPPSSLDLAD